MKGDSVRMALVHFICALPESKYIRLMTSAFAGRYAYRFSSLESIEQLGADSIIHIHWEEFSLRSCDDAAAAMRRAEFFAGILSNFRDRGGRIALTIHNELPHSDQYIEAFLVLRRRVGRMADIVFVHDVGAAELMGEQLDDHASIIVLPHPSSLDVYETREALEAALPTIPNRTLLGFGAMRTQKGFDDMIVWLPQQFLKERGASIRLSGVGHASQNLIADYGYRSDIHFDFRYVPDQETPSLLRNSAAVVLPYKRMLTSGVALLALTFGGVVVAPDTTAMRHLLPEVGHSMLFRSGDAEDFRRAIDTALSLGTTTRQTLVARGLEIAKARHPLIVSGQLAAHYDIMLAGSPHVAD